MNAETIAIIDASLRAENPAGLPGGGNVYMVTSAVLRSDGTALIEVACMLGTRSRYDFDERGRPIKRGAAKRVCSAVARAFAKIPQTMENAA